MRHSHPVAVAPPQLHQDAEDGDEELQHGLHRPVHVQEWHRERCGRAVGGRLAAGQVEPGRRLCAGVGVGVLGGMGPRIARDALAFISLTLTSVFSRSSLTTQRGSAAATALASPIGCNLAGTSDAAATDEGSG